MSQTAETAPKAIPVLKATRANVVTEVSWACKDRKVTKVFPVLRVLTVKPSTPTLLTLIPCLVVVLAKPTLIGRLSACTKISLLRIVGIHKTIAGLSGRVAMDGMGFRVKLERTDEHLTSTLPMQTVPMGEQVSV